MVLSSGKVEKTQRETTVVTPSLKGGVGKSTLTAQIAHNLALLGKRVLVVDLDPNGGISALMGAIGPQIKRTVRDLIDGTAQGVDCVYEPENWQPDDELTARNGGAFLSGGCLHIVPTGVNVADTLALPGSQAELRLRDALAPETFGAEYDIVLLDLHGGETPTLRMALFAAKHVLLPLEPESLEFRGFSLMIRAAIRFSDNHDGIEAIGGVVPQFIAERSMHQDVLAFGKAELARLVPGAAWLEPPVPELTVVKNATARRLPVSAMNAWGTAKSSRNAMRTATAYLSIALSVARSVLGDREGDRLVESVMASDLPTTAKKMIQEGLDATGEIELPEGNEEE